MLLRALQIANARPEGVPKQPKLFIGSSTEALSVARELERQLGRSVQTTVWKDVFSSSRMFLPEFLAELTAGDFVMIVGTPDDVTRCSCAFDRWMAVNTRNEAWVNILREYAWQAATTGPVRSVQDLLPHAGGVRA